MSKIRKEYIECRLFILGDEKVGKKSFVKRLLGLPSTSIIHDEDSEKEYKELLAKYKNDVEQDLQLQKENEAFLKSMNSEEKSRGANEVTSRYTQTNTLFKIEEERTLRKNDRTTKNVTSTLNNIQATQNNLSKSMGIKPGTYKQKVLREPVPEHPAKLYCVNLDKIVIKIFCIPKAEKRPPDFIPRDEDEEYELEKEHNISFDGIKKDLSDKLSIEDTCISEDRLGDFNISIFTLFIFLYDMSNFYSFESLILYYSKITNLFRFNEAKNFKACIIGNKNDKKVLMETEQSSVFNEFLKNTNLKKFEMNTKPYFSFDKFFLEFFFQMFSGFEQNETDEKHKLLENKEFIEEFTKLVRNRPNFPREKREIINYSDKVPGPQYDLNLYNFNTLEERNHFFTDKKSRFKKKIFINEQGPVLHQDKIPKNVDDKANQNKPILNLEVKGGLYNKPINGFSFGIIKGQLNLLQKRKDLRNQRKNNISNEIDRYNNSPIHQPLLKQSRDEEYFENAFKKKVEYKKNIIKERQLKINKILSIHNQNLKKIEEEKKIKYKNILLSKSISSPNILVNNTSVLNNTSKNKERNLIKQRYHDAIYSKNSLYLEKYEKQLSKIRLQSSKQKEPEPYLIDIRNNMLNSSKGVKMHEESKLSIKKNDLVCYPKYRKIKDDFDRIVESAEKKMLNLKNSQLNDEEINKKQIREEKLLKKEQENLINLEKKEEKRKQWIANKEEINLIKKKQMHELSIEKILKHKKILSEEEDKQKLISDLRRDISIQKGYGDPYSINPINYSLIEESSPKYSMKGRYVKREKHDDDIQDLVLGTNIELLVQLKKLRKNQSLPNFNYVKPKLPSIVFNKAERFPRPKPSTDDSFYNPLFENGVFKPPEHKDFICKEPMSELSQRGNIISAYSKSPSPADYKMKSSFDEVVEKGSMINKIRTKINKEKSKLKEKEKDKDKNIKKKESLND